LISFALSFLPYYLSLKNHAEVKLFFMKQLIENQTHIILDSIADGVFTVNLEWKITSFNRAAEEITGIKKK
jgi:PAS domain-containing protein